MLFTYSARAAARCRTRRSTSTAPVENLSKDGSFLGRHIYTRLPGVAVQINAFNFPVWGSLEKFAPAFLAGVPTLVKPATPTGYLAEAFVRILVESGCCPRARCSSCSGSVPDLFDHLRLGDLVGFTGIGVDRRAKLRAHDAVQTGGVRFTSETDSINASRARHRTRSPGTPEFDAYVKQLVVEMTTKAGQKCTAIRRAIVPAASVDALVDARARAHRRTRRARRPACRGRHDGTARLDSSSATRCCARSRRSRRRAASSSIGSTDAPSVVARRRRDAATAPTARSSRRCCCASRMPRARPCTRSRRSGPSRRSSATTRSTEAAALVARGGGSLVTSVATHDPAVARRARVGHRRLQRARAVPRPRRRALARPATARRCRTSCTADPAAPAAARSSAASAPCCTTCSAPPCRVRPRCSPRSPACGTRARRRSRGGEHPFRKSLAELRIGDQVVSASRTVTLDDIETFAAFTGDTFYAHMDEEAAAANPFFPGRVAHGYLLVSWAAGLFVDAAPGPVLANSGLENLRFITPVSPGDTIRVELTAKQITPRETDEYGEVRWDAVLKNQDDELVATYDVLTLVAKEQAAPQPVEYGRRGGRVETTRGLVARCARTRPAVQPRSASTNGSTAVAPRRAQRARGDREGPAAVGLVVDEQHAAGRHVEARRR